MMDKFHKHNSFNNASQLVGYNCFVLSAFSSPSIITLLKQNNLSRC